MIDLTTEPLPGARIVHLHGALGEADDPAALADRLACEAGGELLVVDLSGLTPATGRGVQLLLSALARGSSRAATVLVHPDLETRRMLRAAAGGIPIVPSKESLAHGRFAAALVANAATDPP